MDLEQVVTGIKRGEIKKSRVMNIISNILNTKDYFLKRDPDGQMEILNLVSMFVDVIVSTFNYTGLFKQTERLDFTPIPVVEGAAMTTLKTFLVLCLLLITSCVCKELTPANEVVYEGELVGNDEFTYASAAVVIEKCLAVKTCMGLT